MDYHQLSDADKKHVNAITEHYNSLTPAARSTISNHDHDSLLTWTRKTASMLGIPLGATSAAGVAAYFYKQFRKR